MLAVYDSKSGFYINNRNKTIIIDLNYQGVKESVFADLDDYDKLLEYTYRIFVNRSGKKYVATNDNTTMHELIIGRKAGPGYKIDHINSNGLDNRKTNLRIATDAENGHNKIKKKDTTSKYIGVSAKKDKWFSQIMRDQKTYHLGTYKNEIDAARAYDVWAVYLYKEAANTNTKRLNIPLINENERKWIIDNDKVLPGYEKKHNIKTVSKDLPDNIYRYSKNVNKFMYLIYMKGIRYEKYGFSSVSDAKEALDNFVKMKNGELEEKERQRRNNIIRNKDGIAVIYLKNNQGEIVLDILVDDHVWQDLSGYSWSKVDEHYGSSKINGKKTRMHIYIYETYIKQGKVSPGYSVDHKDPNRPNDNRISNLRENTPRGQAHNRRKRCTSVNKYIGVTIVHGSFVATADGKNFGVFKTEEEAALKYNEIVSELYGDMAKLNIITTSGTKTSDYFQNIDLEFAKSVRSCNILKEIFRTRKDWKEEYDVKLTHIVKDTFDHYKNLLIDIVTKESLVSKSD